ncbi:hypothetical protein BM221_003067 [Beauveria bassiana]|uniref:Uncharacterized protein n=1 Tax=Beauveria bassiana TaxID=176275 RepID=A0A2N6NTL4_BEABA|nr:hypothetical protein BM221_003067 [Beauveria bassiana]
MCKPEYGQAETCKWVRRVRAIDGYHITQSIILLMDRAAICALPGVCKERRVGHACKKADAWPAAESAASAPPQRRSYQ